MNQTLALILASAYVSVQQAAVSPGTLTSDRLWTSAAAILALVGVVVGGLALARAANRNSPNNGKNGAIVALVAGLIAAIVGGLVLSTADGGPGTGNGIVGAFVAIVLGLFAMAEAGLVLARSRRSG